MHILVLGATGTVGFPVAEAFSRAGHIVYGQTRSHEKVKRLAMAEIHPIVSEVFSDAWLSRIGSLDAIINCARGDGSNVSIFQYIAKAAESSRPAGSPKLTYVFTSGTSVHGESRTDIQTDTTPITSPSELAKSNSVMELETLNGSAHVNGIVIRPSLVYGRGEFLMGWWFDEATKAAKEGRKMVVPGSHGNKYAMIHTDDLAQLYLGVVEKAALCKGLAFDAANDFMESTDIIFSSMADLVGANGYEYRQVTNPFEKAVFDYTVLLRPRLAKSLFGWQPKKLGFVDGMHIYYQAWLSTQDK